MSFKDWKEYTLGELITHKKGFAFKSKDLVASGHPIVKVSNFTNDSVDMNGCFYIDSSELPKYKGYAIYQYDVIIATVGSWPNNPNSIVGKVVSVPKRASGSLLNQNSVVLRCKHPYDQRFIYYRLRNKDFSDHLIAGARGSANQASISLEDIFKFKLNLPPADIQRHIASILSSLDDKIELNRQTNQTLEAMAQALFTEMCLPKGEGLPAGWRIKKLGDEIETVSETYKFGDKEKIIFLNTGDIFNGLFLHANYSAVATLPGQAKKKIRKNDILFSEIRPINKRFAFVNFDAEEYVVSTKLMVLRSKRLSPFFLYFYLTREEMIKGLQHIAETRSGTFPQITFSQLENMPIVLPSPEVLEKFVNILEQNFLLQKKNEQENQTLTALRDSLLPKLMKGEFTKIKNKNDS